MVEYNREDKVKHEFLVIKTDMDVYKETLTDGRIMYHLFFYNKKNDNQYDIFVTPEQLQALKKKLEEI